MSGAITPRERGIWANLINRYDICKNGSLDGRADIAIKLRNSRDKNMAGIPIMGKEGVSALGGRSAGKGGTRPPVAGRHLLLRAQTKGPTSDPN